MSIHKVAGTGTNPAIEPQQKLRIGQIVEGKILQLYPNNKAQIQLGMQKMTAQLEANLLVGEKYHFQVQSTGNVIPLKVIGEPLSAQSKTNVFHLLKHLGLKATKANTALVLQLLDNNIVFNRAQLKDAFQLMSNKKSDLGTKDILTEMFSRKLPINLSVFEALQAVKTMKQTESMQKLLMTLRRNNVHSELLNQLSQLIETSSEIKTAPKQQFLQQLQQTLSLTGLSYENELLNEQTEQQKTIKEMLIKLVQGNDGSLKDTGGKLLHFINGMQINSVQESTNFIQANLQIPAERIGLNHDIALEFESRKTKNGEINPEFCRILFYLDLAKLKETVIDMNIQKRSVSLTIFNNIDQLKMNIDALHPLLKKGLEDLDYRLSSISVKPLTEKNQMKTKLVDYKTESSDRGVDYRI